MDTWCKAKSNYVVEVSLATRSDSFETFVAEYICRSWIDLFNCYLELNSKLNKDTTIA